MLYSNCPYNVAGVDRGVPGGGGGDGEAAAAAGLQGGGGGGGPRGDDRQRRPHQGSQGRHCRQQHQGGPHVGRVAVALFL